MEMVVAAFEISLETANKFYAWGWRASILGALVTAIGVILLMWGTRVRDHDTETQLTGAREGTAALEVRAEELRAANLKLETDLVTLQKNVRGREISDQQHDAIIAATKGKREPDLVT